MSNAKADIHAYGGAMNVMSDKDLKDAIVMTCNTIYDTLKQHCGPTATSALIIQPSSGRYTHDFNNIFTKDGINIVDSIEFISPIQTHIKNMIAFVGRRVDAVSHDGTTTSMMLFTDMIRNILEHHSRGIHTVREIEQLFDDIGEMFIENRVTVDDLVDKFGVTKREAIAWVAYHQAMISSKGNKELADTIVKVVDVLPPELYKQFIISQAPSETDKYRFAALDDEFDFVIGGFTNIDNMNHNLKTEYLNEDCDVMIFSSDIISGNPIYDMVHTKIRTHIPSVARSFDEEYVPLERDLIILCDKKVGSHLYDLENLSRLECEHKIVIITTNRVAYGGQNIMLTAIMSSAGVYAPEDCIIDPSRKCIIEHVHLHFKNKYIYISNLYQKTDGMMYHPYLTNPEAFEPYTKLVTALRTSLDDFASGRRILESNNDRAIIEDMTEVYRRLICAKVRRIEIGGSTHDMLANFSVVQDSLGAVLSSIEHGFTIDGLSKILTYLDKIVTSEENSQLNVIAFNCFNDILNIIHGTNNKSYVLNNNGLNVISDDAKFCYHIFGKSQPIELTKLSIDDGMVLIQPVRGYRELAIRFKELLPRIVSTSRAIVPGTVNMNIREEE